MAAAYGNIPCDNSTLASAACQGTKVIPTTLSHSSLIPTSNMENVFIGTLFSPCIATLCPLIHPPPFLPLSLPPSLPPSFPLSLLLQILILVAQFKQSEDGLSVYMFWGIRLSVISVAINPLLYGLLARQYRMAYAYVLRRIFSCCCFCCVEPPLKDIFGKCTQFLCLCWCVMCVYIAEDYQHGT